MSPLRAFVNQHPNTAIIFVVILILFNTAGGAYALYELQDQAATAKRTSLLEDRKLCQSVNQGKFGRIADYKFTLQRTEQFYKTRPHTPKNHRNERLAINFYHSLIAHTRGQLISCPKVP